MIIGILGKKNSGKDVCGNYFENKFNFTKYHYADPLKKILHELLDLTNEQLYGDKKEIVDERYGMTPRFMMQYVGTDLLRNKFISDVWIKKFENIYKNNKNINYCICDVRFQNEVDSIHNLGGIIIKINRKLDIHQTDKHVSENEIDNINNYDFELNNDSNINELYENLNIIYNYILQQKL